jgi:ABC-type antimicrobial peptide transport system permease subunit
MARGVLGILISSTRFYKRSVIYQILIVGLLSAVITGSLLTGWSVRASLKKTAAEHLGNTGILISSGSRYFDPALVSRLSNSARINCTGLLQINGFCQNLNTQKSVSNTQIYAVTGEFFRFQGNDTIKILPGEALINTKLAGSLAVKQGDELIIRFNEYSDIPADAPFAPANAEARSIVLKVGRILRQSDAGNFSLSINQAEPENIFIGLSEISSGKPVKINRLLIGNDSKMSIAEVSDIFGNVMKPSDLGIRTIRLEKTGGFEMRSDRVFLDKSLIEEIKNLIPSAAPVITYLGNSISKGSRSAPYSFVSALPSPIYPDIARGNDIIINDWLAADLEVKQGDALEMSWYAPDSLNKLIEKSNRFSVRRIVKMEGIWGDSLLMPGFPGISGSESCSDWDAGVPVKLSEIRQKDEEYWNRYRGTPKAFINYDRGIELWGNNFGPATAIRFPAGISDRDIAEELAGRLDPLKNGFTIADLHGESLRAANESVDFSSLFLSLGFFLILASVVLLSFAVSTYLESKHSQIRTYFALGFRTGWIKKVLLAESGLISVAGCFTGSFTGILVSMLIIKLLNTVWQGAVQTNALSAFFSLTPILTGFIITLIIALVFLEFKIRLHLRNLNREKKLLPSSPSPGLNLVILLASLAVSIALFVMSQISGEQELSLSFAAGSVLLIFMIFLWRQYFIFHVNLSLYKKNHSGKLSRLYYSFYPSHAVSPVLFISAGLFAVFVTGANRMNFESSQMKPSGGTGGFMLWCENTIPVRADLTSLSGKATFALDDSQLSEMQFIQIKKYAGDDASCLNLNHITVPPLLGVEAAELISRGSFSFAKSITDSNVKNPWQFLSLVPPENTIYGIADQTVLQWGMKIKPGDTLMMRAENGQKLNIIIAAGLKPSVFQGYVLIGMDNFRKYFPSVSGSSIFLVEGNQDMIENYISTLNDRLGSHGIKVERTSDRLASFYEVTNTYLSVFGVYGALGMVTGIAGLGFVLLRNYNHRRKEFALLLATGFNLKKIRKSILMEQVLILVAGMTSGAIPAIIATLPSLKNSSDIPWVYLVSMVIIIFCTGFGVLLLSLRSVTGTSLIASLKKE